MSSRTNPSDALERLAWALNYHRGETVSVNQLAEKTDLSWATTQKYAQLLEVLGRIAPKVTVDKDGVSVQDIGRNIESIWEKKDTQLLLYLLVHAEIKGGPTEPLDYDEHYEVLHQYEETIDRLDELDWIERDGGSIQLKPEGVSIAGPARSQLRNTDTKSDNQTAEEAHSFEKPKADWNHWQKEQSDTTKFGKEQSSSDSKTESFTRTEAQSA